MSLLDVVVIVGVDVGVLAGDFRLPTERLLQSTDEPVRAEMRSGADLVSLQLEKTAR